MKNKEIKWKKLCGILLSIVCAIILLTPAISTEAANKKLTCKVGWYLENVSMMKGTTENIYVSYKGNSVKTSQIKYTYSKKNIVKIDKNGVVTAKKAGTTTVTCKYKGSKCKIKITVNNPYISNQGQKVTKIYVPKGMKVRLYAETGSYENKWSVKNNAIAKVIVRSGSERILIGKQVGTTTVNAKSKTSKAVASAKVIVLPTYDVTLDNMRCVNNGGKIGVAFEVNNRCEETINLGDKGLLGDEYSICQYPFKEGTVEIGAGQTKTVTISTDWEYYDGATLEQFGMGPGFEVKVYGHQYTAWYGLNGKVSNFYFVK